jgi:RNA-directed DNA polymerase
MQILDWLLSLLRPRPVSRRVSSLSTATTSDDAAEVREVVDVSGGPLKPGHRRRALRDRRLLPKEKPKTYAWPRPKKPTLYTRAEAARLFSDTLRTRDRNIRDLVADPEQLQRYALPLWNSDADVAAALGITVKQLQHYSIHRQRETTSHYVTFAVPKRAGGMRLIHAPKRRLKAIQRKLNELLVQRLPVSEAAHGFRTGRNVASNAAAHLGKAIVIKLDIADCFPSIGYGRVRGLLIALGYGYAVATTLAVLMTEAPRQPVEIDGTLYHVPVGPRVCVQGAPTSPALCNAVLMRMDRRLHGLAKKRGFTYSRYADDLTLSGNDCSQVKLLLTVAARIVREEGFRLNPKKTRVLHRARCQRVTGVVVNKVLGLSRKERRRLRAAIHQLGRGPKLQQSASVHLAGKLAYLHMLNPLQAEPLRRALGDVLGKLANGG